ncbi:MAG: topoisomerase C-terminal repeat-containing protein, partial [Pseudomonadota bacterium]
YTVRVVGTVVTFDGFLKLYQEGRDDEADEAERRLPKMAEGDSVNTKKISATQHFTEPPPRYSEASLVKRMEELGIGRPSTYASTLAVLVDREYVRNESRRLFPEDKGRLVTAFLMSFFARYVEYDFTAALEEDLDEISDGKLEWKQVLRDFWREFTSTVDGTKELRITDVLDALNEALAPIAFPPREDGSDPRVCIACGTGQLSLKVGRYGAFVGCSNHPECKFTRPLGESDEEAAKKAKADGRVLGQDEETGLDITVRSGRFGPYIQVGEQEGKEKPKRASIPAGYDAASLTYDEAVQLLALPRPVGVHPETSKPIVAGFGRYGPFVECAGTYANLDDAAEVFTVGINRAVALLADKSKAKAKRGGSAIREIGPHPADKQMIEVMEGRYGTYLRHGKVNATLPKGTEQADITLEQAVEIIKERGKAAGSKAGAKKTTTARSGGTKAAGSKAAGSKATGSKAGTSKAVGSKSTAAKGTAAKAKGTTKAAGSTTRKSPAKKPAASAAKRKPANKSSEAPS